MHHLGVAGKDFPHDSLVAQISKARGGTQFAPDMGRGKRLRPREGEAVAVFEGSGDLGSLFGAPVDDVVRKVGVAWHPRIKRDDRYSGRSCAAW